MTGAPEPRVPEADAGVDTASRLVVTTGLPADDGGPVFAEAWHADAFALAGALIDAGLITPAEWSDTLSQAILDAQAAGDPDLGDTYYDHWTEALTRLCASKGLVPPDELAQREQAWRDAYEQTPHGQPVELQRVPPVA